MRSWFGIFSAIVVASPLSPALAEQAFPYKAYVAANDTYVRSGPGENYYPTGKLNARDQVEVYRHDPGGWYAIRPPEGSFSWIGGRFLRPMQDGLAEVIGQRVAVRVGTSLTDERDVVQVHVRRGEILEILGSEPTGSGRSAGIWYKISPPSGEFRWIRGSDVDLSPPRGPRGSKAARDAAPPRLSQDAPRVPPAALPHLRTPAEFQKELDDINTELSTILAEEPTAWNCKKLDRRARALLDQAQTAVERGQSRMLVNRIAQSEDVQRRSVAMSAATDLDRRGRVAALTRGADDRFDGVGRLARVQQSKLGAPRYALVDEQGNVRAYVSPAPGVAMQPYVGHLVGISGVRGYIAEQNANHLTAMHITALDTRLR